MLNKLSDILCYFFIAAMWACFFILLYAKLELPNQNVLLGDTIWAFIWAACITFIAFPHNRKFLNKQEKEFINEYRHSKSHIFIFISQSDMTITWNKVIPRTVLPGYLTYAAEVAQENADKKKFKTVDR